MRTILMLLVLVMTGCAYNGPKIMSSGSAIDFKPAKPISRTAMVVGDNASAVQAIVSILQRLNFKVVERANMDRLMQEQAFQLIHGDHADTLRLGQMLGASQVVFVESSIQSRNHGEAAFASTGLYGAGRHTSHEVRSLGVNVRGVLVDNGLTLWTGSAWLDQDVDWPADPVLSKLADRAYAHAMCSHPVNRKAFHWSDEKQECQKTSS